MSENILTKEEYTEKLNNTIKPMIELAMSTKQFNDSGCYSEEFVKIGDKEVTLAVVNRDWRIVHKTVYEDMIAYKKFYYDLRKKTRRAKSKES